MDRDEAQKRVTNFLTSITGIQEQALLGHATLAPAIAAIVDVAGGLAPVEPPTQS